MASKLDMINKIAQRVPVVNDEAAKQLEAGRNVQLQASLGAAPTALPAARIAQSLAPQAAAQAGQIQTASAAKTNEDLANVAAKSLAQQKTELATDQGRQVLGQRAERANIHRQQGLNLNREDIASQKVITKAEQESSRRLSEYGIEQDNKLLDVSLKQRKELAAVGADVKTQILDSRLQFARNEAGRKFSNDRQLMDYTIATAKTEVEFRSRMQEMRQASDRKIQLMEQSAQKLVEAAKRGFLTSEQTLDYNQKVYLLNLAKEMEEKIAKEKAKNNNKLMVAQGVGSAIGGVVGGIYGGPVGAMAGASAGGAVGSVIGGAL